MIVEEGDYDDENGLTRRSQALIALLGFVVLFTVFCLIIWGAARPFKAEVTVKVCLHAILYKLLDILYCKFKLYSL